MGGVMPALCIILLCASCSLTLYVAQLTAVKFPGKELQYVVIKITAGFAFLTLISSSVGVQKATWNTLTLKKKRVSA